MALTEDRKSELAMQFASDLQRYLDKQWIDDQTANMVGENAEEVAFLRELNYWVDTDYS